MEGCDLCQRMKNGTEELAGKLKLSKMLEKTMDASNSRLYYEATGSSRKGCNIGSM